MQDQSPLKTVQRGIAFGSSLDHRPTSWPSLKRETHQARVAIWCGLRSVSASVCVQQVISVRPKGRHQVQCLVGVCTGNRRVVNYSALETNLGVKWHTTPLVKGRRLMSQEDLLFDGSACLNANHGWVNVNRRLKVCCFGLFSKLFFLSHPGSEVQLQTRLHY